MCARSQIRISKSPFQHDRIIRAGETYILHPDDVQIRSAAEQSTQYAVVEIFVCGKAEHGLGGTLTLSGE